MMKKMKSVGGLFMVLVLVSAFSAGVFAGDMEPSAGPAPTMHTLEDLYHLIANIGTAPVEKTGLTTSYATGDDGDLQKGIAWPVPRFTDNGDGTVTDHLTGLVWLQYADRFGLRTWAQALGDCNSLADDGINLTDGSVAGDWRLPNVKELLSLIDYSNDTPALPTGHPFIGVQVDRYWLSNSYPHCCYDEAWEVDMLNGMTGTLPKAYSHYVWPVRGGN